jgi:hypothetical protein
MAGAPRGNQHQVEVDSVGYSRRMVVLINRIWFARPAPDQGGSPCFDAYWSGVGGAA